MPGNNSLTRIEKIVLISFVSILLIIFLVEFIFIELHKVNLNNVVSKYFELNLFDMMNKKYADEIKESTYSYVEPQLLPPSGFRKTKVLYKVLDNLYIRFLSITYSDNIESAIAEIILTHSDRKEIILAKLTTNSFGFGLFLSDIYDDLENIKSQIKGSEETYDGMFIRLEFPAEYGLKDTIYPEPVRKKELVIVSVKEYVGFGIGIIYFK